jgi:hypothetical protein
MASANLDLVRSICTAWEGGDFGSAEWAHPEIEIVRADGPSPGRWIGLTGMSEATRNWLSSWERARLVVDAYRELDDERVLLLVKLSGRGKSSCAHLAQLPTKGAFLFHVIGGQVTRFVHYLDRDRAPAELGLTGEAGSERP